MAETGAEKEGAEIEDGLLKLDVVVTDVSGNAVAGLGPNAFTLLENHQKSKILSFRAFDEVQARPSQPVEVILLIDALEMSPGEDFAAEREVAKFLRQNDGRLTQPVSIFFLYATGLWSPSTPQPSTDGLALAASLSRKTHLQKVWNPASEKESASPFSLNSLPSRALADIGAQERVKPGRKLLLWLGPEAEVGSTSVSSSGQEQQHLFTSIVWFSTLLREARIALYSIPVRARSHAVRYSQPGDRLDSAPVPPYRDALKSVSSAREATIAYLDQRMLAVQSGGRALGFEKDLAAQISRCVADTVAFYTLTFDPMPASHPDEYHDLEVVIDKPELTAHTNTGFYDQPYYLDRANLALQAVGIGQLQQLLETSQGKSDGELARELSGLELTERLSSSQLAIWRAHFSGTKSRQALTVLADGSMLLPPPATEILNDLPPDIVARRQILSRTVDYLTKAVSQLPNLFAMRTTDLYEETPAKYEQAGKPGIGYEPVHFAGSLKATVRLQQGKEVEVPTKEKGKAVKASEPASVNLDTVGTFGALLSTVVMDSAATSDGFTWARWEKGTNGPVAVFRYSIPSEKSHYQIVSCCLPEGTGRSAFRKTVGYHGEMSVDPSNGDILRLTLSADLKESAPTVRSDIAIEYAPVLIGPNTHICPVRSVSILRGRTVRVLKEWDASFRSFGPFVTLLNDVVFSDYHLFGSESRILPGFSPVP